MKIESRLPKLIYSYKMFYKIISKIMKIGKLSEIIKEEVHKDFFIIENRHSLKKFEEVLVKVYILNYC